MGSSLKEVNKTTIEVLPEGYQLRSGSKSDRPTLEKFLYLTYQELFPEQKNWSHLSKILEMYFTRANPFWLVERLEVETKSEKTIAVCWVGNAIDPVKGDRYGQILLVYVDKQHRRKGIASHLIRIVRNWAKSRGDRQVGLMVSNENRAGLELYRTLGFKPSLQLLTIEP